MIVSISKGGPLYSPAPVPVLHQLGVGELGVIVDIYEDQHQQAITMEFTQVKPDWM